MKASVVRRQIKINKIIKNWKQGLGTYCSSGWDLRVRPKSKCCETASKRSGVIGGSNPRVQTLRAIVGGFLTHRKLANFRENLPKHPCSIYVITLSSNFGGERERENGLLCWLLPQSLASTIWVQPTIFSKLN